MSRTFELNCFVLNDDATGDTFLIKIEVDKTVGALKEAIKEKKKHALQHVDADDLIIWKVLIPVNKHFKDNLKKLDFDDGESLLSVEELSGVFSDYPAPKQLHIVVKAPPGESQWLICLWS